MKNWNIIIYLVLLVIILFLLIKPSKLNIFENKNCKNIPEECKVPAGQNTQSWKEHLGHHENTKYCLKYYK